MHVEGHGPPLLVIPGLQGHWQWMRPGIRALAAHCRVATYSLAGEGGDVLPLRAASFDDLVRQARNALRRAGMRQAAVCGVSYGGLIAMRLAARHPELVSALVLASTLPTDFVPDRRVERLLAHPRLLAPTFLAGAPARYLPELRAARPADWPWCATAMLATVARRPQSPVRMAERIRFLAGEALDDDARRVGCPTLVVTGDDELDALVPPATSRRLLALMPQAQALTMRHTGHFGMVTQPAHFARVVHDFLAVGRDGVGRDGSPSRPSGVGRDGSPSRPSEDDRDGSPSRPLESDEGHPTPPSLPWGDLT